jgi:hypothetical protein
MNKEKYIWEVSVLGYDWDYTICETESDAYDKLQEYFDTSEDNGETIADPCFKRILVTDFKWLCSEHGNKLVYKRGALRCEQCDKETNDGVYHIEPSYKIVKPPSSN